MRPVATDVALSVCLSVCLLITTKSCAKTAEPIEMPGGVWTRVGGNNDTFSVSTALDYTLSHDQLRAASLVGRNDVTWRSSLSNYERVGGRHCNVARSRDLAS